MQERKAKRQAKADLIAQRKNRDRARAAANAAKKNNEKIPGAPKACRVSASYCICSQPIKARCAG